MNAGKYRNQRRLFPAKEKPSIELHVKTGLGCRLLKLAPRRRTLVQWGVPRCEIPLEYQWTPIVKSVWKLDIPYIDQSVHSV